MSVVIAFLLGGLVAALILRRPDAPARKAGAAAVAAAERAATAAASAVVSASTAAGAAGSAALAAAQAATDAASAAKQRAGVTAAAKAPARVPAAAAAPAALRKPRAAKAAPKDAVPVPATPAAPTDAVPTPAAPAALAKARTAPADARPVVTSPVAAPKEEDGLLRFIPVELPKDALVIAPEPYRGERFHYAGSQTGKAATEQEFAIDWPQPGAVAVAEITARLTGRVEIVPMTRTRDRVETHSALLDQQGGTHRRRALLTRDMTHLKVKGEDGARQWSVRLFGPADLGELVEERQGNGQEILAVRGETPVEVMAHFLSGYWSVWFVCGCWAGQRCKCQTPSSLAKLGYLKTSISGSHEGAEALVVPRPGLLVIGHAEPKDQWVLRTRPLGRASRAR